MTTAHASAAPPGRPLALAVTTAAITGGLALVGALALGIPLRDPDGFLGPSWLRMPLIVGACLLLDVVPRALWRNRSVRELPAAARAVLAERWPWRRLLPVVLAVACFYVTYVGYRNLKNFLPFVFDRSNDFALVALDRTMTLGYDPAYVLHTLLGTGLWAELLSAVYTSFLFFVPISVAASLIWSKNLSIGLWYVSALCVNWALGTFSYYLIPASGPFWALPWEFLDLQYTDVTALQDSLLRNRVTVMEDPAATPKVSGVAAFASLHVSIIFTAALIVELVKVHPLVRRGMWAYFALTALATIYFGWHYIIDDMAGMAIGGIAVWLGAWATGNLHVFRRGAAVTAAPERESVLSG